MFTSDEATRIIYRLDKGDRKQTAAAAATAATATATAAATATTAKIPLLLFDFHLPQSL